MAHLSKRILKSGIKDQLKTVLVHIIKTLDNKDDAETFLNAILTDTEQLMIAKRIAATYLLKHNVPASEICELIKLTPETVIRLKLQMTLAGNRYNEILNNLETLKRNKIVKEMLFKILNYAIVTGSGRIPNPFKEKFNSNRKTPSVY